MSTDKAGALGCILGAIIAAIFVGMIWLGVNLISNM
jgi:hypothetical protein